MGEPFVVAKPEEAAARAQRFREYVASPVLTQVRLDFGTFDAYNVEPPAVPDVLAERPVIVFGKWRGQASGHITVRGITGIAPYLETFDVGHVKPVRRNVALRYLWARHRIAVLGDYTKLQRDDERVKEITTLGLTYNLLTDYTSFVAIDTVVRNTDGKFETVTQPLPLPQGVSDFAVGGQATKMASAPAYQAMGAPAGVEGGVAGGLGGVERFAEGIVVAGGKPVVTLTPHDATGPSSSNHCITFEEASRIGGVCWAFEHAALGWRFPSTTSVSTIRARLKLVQGSPVLVAVTISGTATRGEAERVVRAHLAETRACLEKAVAPGAELVITLTVRANGTVDHVQIVSYPT
jgi:hypothetical protein